VTASEWIVDRAVLPHVVTAGARITADGGRITAIEPFAAATRAERLRGTLLPGFVDLQVNGAGGAAVTRPLPPPSTPSRPRSGPAARWRSCRR
jgi:N-acetylglucosamine-6-phosphate deacetylase